jgi:hypothetical protein
VWRGEDHPSVRADDERGMHDGDWLSQVLGLPMVPWGCVER